MAPLPKRRLSRQRGRERLEGQRTMDNLAKNLIICPNCKQATVAHLACRICGYYKGKKVTTPKSK